MNKTQLHIPMIVTADSGDRDRLCPARLGSSA